MRTECNPELAGFDGGAITSDAGALLLGTTDRAIRLVDRFAACTLARIVRLFNRLLSVRTWPLAAPPAGPEQGPLTGSLRTIAQRPTRARRQPDAGSLGRSAVEGTAEGPAPRYRLTLLTLSGCLLKRSVASIRIATFFTPI
jgi:hypothetical protein